MDKYLRGGVGIVYSAIMGVIAGFLSWLFLYLVYLGIHLFWDSFILQTGSKFLILGVCIIGGILVGLCEKYIGHYPKSLHHVVAEFKTNKRVEYKDLPKSVVKMFAVLWFGGTVGPEAGVSGIIGGLATYFGEFLKFGFKRKKHSMVKIDSKLHKIFEIPLYGFYNYIDYNDEKKRKNIKRILYASAIIFGLGIFILCNVIDSKASFITRFSKAILNVKDFEYIIPLFLIGLLIVLYSAMLDSFVKKVFGSLIKYKILAAIIGGIILGCSAILIPFMLFSGEHTLKELLEKSTIFSVGLLIMIGLFKLLISKICIFTGWIGGPIFPIMFSSAAFGIAVSHIFNINLTFAVAIIMSTVLAGIMKNFKITFVLLIFFFSINIWVFILIAAIISEFTVKKAELIFRRTKVAQ